MASPGEVVVNQAGETPSVDVSSIRKFGDITLSGFSIVDVSGFDTGEIGAGTIIIRGGNLQMTSCRLNAQTFGAVSANPVGIDIALTGDMLMEQGSYIYAQNFGPANGGDIKIKAANLQMQEMAMIAAASLGPGNAGNITVNVDNNLTLLPITEISSNTVDTGRGGNISITAKEHQYFCRPVFNRQRPLYRYSCSDQGGRGWRRHHNQGRQHSGKERRGNIHQPYALAGGVPHRGLGDTAATSISWRKTLMFRG